MKEKRGQFDYKLITVVLILASFGMVMLYSASGYGASIKYHGDDMFLLKRQAIYMVIGCVMAFGISFIDYRRLFNVSLIVYAVALVAMALVRFSPLGRAFNGSRRWLGIGSLTMQPSELGKIAVILFIPAAIVKMGRYYKGFRPFLVVFFISMLQAFAAYAFTDNASTAIIIALIAMAIMFVAHPSTKPFVITAVVLVIICAGAVFLISGMYKNADLASLPFRIRRILVWLDPEQYAKSGGYQVLQGLYAVGSGGLFGKGLGKGIQKLGPIPEAENDMIFSIVCEELGLFGGFILIFLFVYLIYRLYIISRQAGDKYGGLIATGIMAHISAQVFLNIAVVIGLIPTTGVTLPFVSYGGTSVLFLMIEIGLALSVSRRDLPSEGERDLWGEET